MNQPTAIPTPAASGTSGTSAAFGAEHSQEDRLLAAASYLGYLVGFWLVVPIVIYVLKRDKSRFVAFHSLQAIIVHALLIPIVIGGWILGFLGTMLFVLAVNPRGATRDEVGVLFLLPYLFGLLVPWALHAVFSIVCAVRAMQGRIARFPLAAWMTDRFLAGDKGVAQR